MSENPLMSLFRQSEKDRRPYSQTLEKGMLWPVVKSGYTGKPEWSTEGGLIGSAIDAFTLPGRVMKGEVAPDDPGEMINFVGNVLGGGMAANMRRGVNPGVASMSGAQPPKQQGIRAYHGSPHDFDRFDMSKIGTGEGAQAYGHGLYFAENEGVAKSYRDALKADNPNKLSSATDRFKHLEIDGKPIDQQFDIDAAYIDEFKAKIASGDDLRPLLGEKLARWQQMSADSTYPFPDYARDKIAAYDGLIKRINEGGTVRDAGAGRMYEVNIKADPADFLDWDKPLSQQSEKVRKAADKAWGGYLDESGSGRRYAPTSPEMVQKFRDHGIPGIRYLDQGSRAAGEGSSNYVVFDDKLIEILRKYGLLGGVVGGGAMAGGTDAQAGQ